MFRPSPTTPLSAIQTGISNFTFERKDNEQFNYTYQSASDQDADGPCPRLNICMVSDFFFPGVGGVESHIYSIAQCLIKKGHKVIVIANPTGTRNGVRYLTNGVKVYYIPVFTINTPSGRATLPFMFSLFPVLRNIFVRERIQIVHGHQCTSNMAMEALLHARTMGLKCCFTDHSLFGFGDTAGLHINKVCKYVLADVDHIICVSHTSRENLVMRAAVNPFFASVIPHAVDSGVFMPIPEQSMQLRRLREFLKNPANKKSDVELTIVTVTRLAYRKGADLLVAIIPRLCELFPKIKFVIGGDGPKKIDLEEMRERYRLEERVELLGSIPHSRVAEVIRRGQIFINTSLTEAFCIAILEASSCGLFVVSTRVGGVPEVLPDDMCLLSDPDPDSLVQKIIIAIEQRMGTWDPERSYQRIKSMYDWHHVATRTENVYRKVISNRHKTLFERFQILTTAGDFYGKFCCMMSTIDYFIYRFLEWSSPRDQIDDAIDLPGDAFHEEEELSTSKDKINKTQEVLDILDERKSSQEKE
ncbi:N-acetylglucosaminyl-phosphatidylinositol biosynthetic protein [Acrasis kona]|uniref:phosphatidylinositol N-acetylglucosaminyltransferase n=1 Tax=Acrasis kona TaxID=1008807 RepID=A0AAW2Z9P1_9EUKA